MKFLSITSFIPSFLKSQLSIKIPEQEDEDTPGPDYDLMDRSGAISPSSELSMDDSTPKIVQIGEKIKKIKRKKGKSKR